MDERERQAFETAVDRYEALRRLAERHESGELSDDAFRQLRQRVLRRGTTTAIDDRGVFEVMLASYSDADRLRVALAGLRELQLSRGPDILDAAIGIKAGNGAVRIRAIGDLTRRVVAGRVSIIAAVCGLLFMPASLIAEYAGTPMEASFSRLEPWSRFSPELRAFGDGLAPGSASIIVIVWSSSADAVAAAFHGFDSLSRVVLTRSAANELLTCLGEEQA
jgi:uncharacterized membrane protein